MSSSLYDNKFYDMIDAGSSASAQQVIELLQQYLSVTSVADIGCGRGAWLERWKQAGVNDIKGVDGSYVDKARLYIPEKDFVAHDLSTTLNLGRKFDLAQSLEVAEHLPESVADTFVTTLTRHAPIILFSAAIPGQPGFGHINAQPHEYWRKKFAAHGFFPIDIRKFLKEKKIDPWYRYNIFLFAIQDSIQKLDERLKPYVVSSQEPLKITWPAYWRIIWAVYDTIPQSVKTHPLLVAVRNFFLKIF